jgi:hypothetical protein
MTKTIVVHRNPSARQMLKTPINSIIAAAKTAHDLESACRKATRDKPTSEVAGHDLSGGRKARKVWSERYEF